ncbi:magnesium/cobalt transporter CorA [uncultured Desulfosarcina sp.]|uniref:magnesium/cobalt transporter CorA n=1 Tax=uncultured Desulfosarcina sp. TaxID=218289 RepID=UPI0029C843C8|nr:magnesium/cobalt transporter CorA [uncultured Desulfosarcina sp.]
MSRFTRKSSKKAGSSPGTLVHVGERKTDDVHLALLHYDAETVIEKPLELVEEALPLLTSSATTWLNIDGIHDISLMEHIGKIYGVHPLTLEDVLNTTQRPKTEAFDGYLFIVLKMLHYDAEKEGISSEQVSLILGKTFLITFQEVAGDVFTPVRERIRKGKGQIRTGGCDYLAYALIDAIVDNYFVILEKVGQRLETLEETIDENPDAGMLEEIHAIRHDLIYLRKQVWPLREIIAHLQKDGAPFVGEAIGPFLRDVYDHTIQTIDTIESFRDILSGMQDLYLSIISNRMNEVMKVLTIIATIFIPITFVAGIYGMNFTHMPELAWRWGYLFVWIVILAIIIGMLVFFRRRKWV